MIKKLILATGATALVLQCAAAQAAATYKIVTANTTGTYYKIAQDLAKYVAPAADIALEVVPTKGSAENMKLLRQAPDVKLAIIQADVFQAFVDRAAAGNAEAARIVRPLRIVTPLYNTEIHYIVRSDSKMNYIHDIKDARINGGVLGSGAAFFTATLYRMMFNQEIPEQNASYFSNSEALIKLITDKSVDVVVVAAGQPAPLIAHMKPEAQKYIKLLKFDPSNPVSKPALRVYAPATVRAASYPNLISEDFTTISVGAYLVTYDYTLEFTVAHLMRFAHSLCEHFSTLQEKGHPKWREVELNMPALNDGWNYYGPTAKELRKCIAERKAIRPAKACSPEARILGLCD
jgi:TRAP transporter TAXI family solute receptor